jgi:predicted short-subunit dehydrogenase-like oxidoreductase (DUF2520 family)
MRVGIIGAGKLGCSMAIGLSKIGFEVAGIYSKSYDSALELNKILFTKLENSLYATVKNSELVFVTTPDNTISQVADDVANLIIGENIKGKYFFHCSGSLTSDVLEPIRLAGGFTASLHPIQTFADRLNGWKGLFGIYFGYEGEVRAKDTANEIVKAFNGTLLTIGKADKPLYHAAACILSNYLVTLSYVSGKLFDEIGIDPGIGFKAFSPLVKQTIENISTSGSVKSLTGPISRGDFDVIEKHIKGLTQRVPEVLEVYKVLGRTAIEVANAKGSLDEYAAEKISNILK